MSTNQNVFKDSSMKVKYHQKKMREIVDNEFSSWKPTEWQKIDLTDLLWKWIIVGKGLNHYPDLSKPRVCITGGVIADPYPWFIQEHIEYHKHDLWLLKRTFVPKGIMIDE